ncbi:MAG: 6-phosphogluconolactonase [Pedobacter sp.]
MAKGQTIHWHQLPDTAAVAENAASRILAEASKAIAQRGIFRLVLAGGRTPEATYRLLAKAEADWRRWEIFFGDERCLPAGHSDRNSTMAVKAWLDHVNIPREQIHIIPAEKGPIEGARLYSPVVDDALPFDLVILGLGEDGHTASLFPGHHHPEEILVVPVTGAPKPPSERVSLTAKTLSQARQVLVVVTGPDKQEAVTKWKKGHGIPISSITALEILDVILDTEANISTDD